VTVDSSPPSPYPFRIRDAVPGDHAVIVEFNRRLAEETEDKRLDPEVVGQGVARALADPHRLRYWVVEHVGDRRVVAQTAISREWSDWRNGWLWWLQSVYVAAEHRGQGLFKSLYRHIRDQALADPDVIGVRLYVEDGNHRAQQAYQALGFRPGGYSVLEELWLDRDRGGVD
jgi:GNAT superfamily N-acetyltransferase